MLFNMAVHILQAAKMEAQGRISIQQADEEEGKTDVQHFQNLWGDQGYGVSMPLSTIFQLYRGIYKLE